MGNTHNGLKPADLHDAAIMALDEALSEAGFAPLSEQVIACDDLEAAVLDALWNDDATLQEAARSAVRSLEQRLIGEVQVCDGVLGWAG